MDLVNESTTSWLSVDFLDKSGVAATPTSASYSIWNKTTDASILASTSLGGLSSSMDIEITAAQNALSSRLNEREIHRVTVVSGYSDGSQLTAAYEYAVLNLSFGD